MLTGKVAIVTGGGRGLGRAMAQGLASAGANVIVTASRQATEIESLAAASNGEIIPCIADVGQAADCARVVALATERFGRLDILVNNAGRGMKFVSEHFMTEPTKFWNTDPAIWQMVIDTNVNGPFFMARAAAPVMIAAGWGRIVNISMNQETMRRAGFSPYGPSKAAVESETIIWAQDLKGTGVTVNALLPGGATATGMIPDGCPTDNLLRPEIMVAPLLWLLSPDADDVTGRRVNAEKWRGSLAGAEEGAGWP
jgi:3-oxoacyl-[acyl-carrier protein] reductase